MSDQRDAERTAAKLDLAEHKAELAAREKLVSALDATGAADATPIAEALKGTPYGDMLAALARDPECTGPQK